MSTATKASKARTFADLIPDDLHMSTGERLLLVADIIEQFPDEWDQYSLWAGDGYITTSAMVGSGGKCGTKCCVAGWATMVTPRDEVLAGDPDPDDIAMRSLGLQPALGDRLFYGWPNLGLDDHDAPGFATVLRTIAALPEPRTVEAYEAAVES